MLTASALPNKVPEISVRLAPKAGRDFARPAKVYVRDANQLCGRELCILFSMKFSQVANAYYATPSLLSSIE